MSNVCVHQPPIEVHPTPQSGVLPDPFMPKESRVKFASFIHIHVLLLLLLHRESSKTSPLRIRINANLCNVISPISDACNGILLMPMAVIITLFICAQVLDQESMPVLFSLVFGEGVINDATSVSQGCET